MQLYDMPISGNCYKIRLLLSLLDIPYDRINVDVKSGENKTDVFLQLNPNGLLPVLVDNDSVIYDSAAILVYLAGTYAPQEWMPTKPGTLAQITRWLAFEQSEGRYGLARARAMKLQLPSPLSSMGTLEEAQSLADIALYMLQTALSHQAWLAGGDSPSIADIACYPYTALANEGGLNPQDYPAVSAWMARIEALPGYVELPRSI